MCSSKLFTATKKVFKMTKSLLYSAYESDPELEKNGVWVELEKGLEVKVAAFGNDSHLKYLKTLKKPYTSQYRRDAVPSHVDEEIHLKAMCKEVLIDWRGEEWKDRDNNPLPYSPDNAFNLLSDPRMKKLKGDILFIASSTETFNPVDKEDSIKN